MQGLGFNRAFLFLYDDKSNCLKGHMAVGPSSPEEAGHIWGRLQSENRSLDELLDAEKSELPEKSDPINRLIEGMEFDLSAYEGMQVLFRLSYFTDDYTLEEGVYIDDVENVEMFSGSTEISSSITDNYYDFTSKPNGEYWYTVSAIDAEDQEGRPSLLAHTEVTSVVCCEITGDVDHDGDLDPLDAQYFVRYFWDAGPPPVCDEEADIEGDLDIDPLDVVALVNYFWRGGPPPAECHPLPGK